MEGRQTYIVGYAFTPTGVEEPTVGNDWYPVDLDVYDNQEHASVDAYIASEEGQATLQGCGVSGLVPLATATQRLAENGINITVHDEQGLYKREGAGTNGLLVDKNGQAVYFVGGSTNYVLQFYKNSPTRFYVSPATGQSVAVLITEFGLGTQLPAAPASGSSYTIDGITYTVTENEEAYIFTPDPPAWT